MTRRDAATPHTPRRHLRPRRGQGRPRLAAPLAAATRSLRSCHAGWGSGEHGVGWRGGHRRVGVRLGALFPGRPRGLHGSCGGRHGIGRRLNRTHPSTPDLGGDAQRMDGRNRRGEPPMAAAAAAAPRRSCPRSAGGSARPLRESTGSTSGDERAQGVQAAKRKHREYMGGRSGQIRKMRRASSGFCECAHRVGPSL